jgi:hypothetical protein
MDDILIAIILAGIGFSGVYLRAELVLHRRMTALRRRRELVKRDFHAKRVGLGQNDVSRQPRTVPSSIQANVFHVMRVLVRVSRIYIQEHKIHRFWIRT